MNDETEALLVKFADFILTFYEKELLECMMSSYATERIYDDEN